MNFPKHLKTACFGMTVLFLTACQTTSSKEVYVKAFHHNASDGTNNVENEAQAKADIQNYRFADLSPGERPEITSDEAGLWMMMDRAEKELATSGNRILDPELNAYVKGIVCKLAQDYCGDFRVYVVRVPAFNATMAPNGTMTIYSGFLLRAKNEAQLAAVIGHEITHYLRRHSAQRVKDIVEKSGALAFVQLASIAAGVGAVGDLAALATLGSVQSFSRDHEREADGYGLALMARAGYDPHQAPKIWERVIRERNAADEKPPTGSFLATHPPSEERNTMLGELATTVENAAELRVGELRYQNAIAPIRKSLLQDEIAGGNFDTTSELLNILLEDGHNLSELYYFRGELYRHRNQDDDNASAISAYNKSISEGAPLWSYISH